MKNTLVAAILALAALAAAAHPGHPTVETPVCHKQGTPRC